MCKDGEKKEEKAERVRRLAGKEKGLWEGTDWFKRHWLRGLVQEYKFKVLADRHEENDHRRALEYILEDERLSDKGKPIMLALIEDQKNTQDCKEKMWEYSNGRGRKHEDIERELYAHFECSMEMVEKCFDESPHKEEIAKADRRAAREHEKAKKERAQNHIWALERQRWRNEREEKEDEEEKEKEKDQSLKRKGEEDEEVRNGKNVKVEAVA